MRKLLLVIPLVFLLCFTFSCQKGEEVAEEPVIDLAAEKVKVESVIDQWSEALKNEDIALFEKILAQEPNCIFIGTDAAEYWTNWAEFRESILKQFEAIDTTNIATKNKIVRVNKSGEIAWFSLVMNVDAIAQGEQVKIEGGRFTGVLEKRDGGWVIVQFHLSLPVVGQAIEY